MTFLLLAMLLLVIMQISSSSYIKEDRSGKSTNNALSDFWRENGADVKVDEVMQLDEYCGRIPPAVYLNQARQELQNGTDNRQQQ